MKFSERIKILVMLVLGLGLEESPWDWFINVGQNFELLQKQILRVFLAQVSLCILDIHTL